MNTKGPFSRRGFTLIELLVVIAIIAILAGVVLSAGTAALNAAKRSKAQNLAVQIQAAASSYYTEYSIYPIPGNQTAGKDFKIQDTDATTWAGMMYGLSGNINPYNGSTTSPGSAAVPNTRAIAFLTLKSSDVDSSNGPLNPIPPNATEKYFFMAVDGDYDGVVGATDTTTPLAMENFTTLTTTGAPPQTATITSGIAVWANCVGSSSKYNSNQWAHTY